MDNNVKKYMDRLNHNDRLRDKDYDKISKKLIKKLFRSDITEVACEYFNILDINKHEASEIMNYLRLKLEVYFVGNCIEHHKKSYEYPAYGLLKQITLNTEKQLGYNAGVIHNLTKEYKLSKNEYLHVTRIAINTISWEVSKGSLKSLIYKDKNKL